VSHRVHRFIPGICPEGATGLSPFGAKISQHDLLQMSELQSRSSQAGRICDLSMDKSLPLGNLATENSLSGFVSVDQDAIAGRNSRVGQHLELDNSV
jgi:hypothetical protein